MSCSNKYCPVEYNADKEPCKSYVHNIKGTDMFSYLKDIVNKK